MPCKSPLWLGYYFQNGTLFTVNRLVPTFTAWPSGSPNEAVNVSYVYLKGWATKQWHNSDGNSPTQFSCQFRPSKNIIE